MQYLVLPLTTNSQSAPGVFAGLGFTLAAGHSGHVLGIDGSGYAVTRAANASESALHFRLEALGGGDVGFFRLVHLASGKVLDVDGKSTASGARYRLSEWVNGQSQHFRPDPKGNGQVTLVSRHSNLALCVKDGSTAEGARIVQAAATSAGHFKWAPSAVPSPWRVYALALVRSGFVATDDGGALKQRRWSEGAAQRWALTPLGGEDVGYFKVSCVGTNRSLTVEGASTSAGARVVTAPYTGARHQHFIVADVGWGRYLLVARHSKMAVTISNEGADNAQMLKLIYEYEGTGFYQQPWTNTWLQQWQVGTVSGRSLAEDLAVTLYEHPSFQGASQRLGPGFWNMSDLSLPNDSVSSIRVPVGTRVTLYEHVDFVGAKVSHDADVAALTTLNDAASSVLVEIVATIYADNDYKGASQSIGVGRYNPANLKIGDDRLSSLRVPPGLMVTLFEDADYKGRRWCFTEDTPQLGAFNDKVSSIVVEQIGVTIPPKVLRYGSSFGLRSYHGKFFNVEASGDLRAAKTTMGSTEIFTVIRAGRSKYRSVVSFGDIVALQASNGRYVVAKPDGDTDATSASITDAERFYVIRSGGTKHNDFVTQDDVISLVSLVGNRYVTAETNDDTNVNRTTLGNYERITVRGVKPPPAADGLQPVSVCVVEFCSGDNCGAAACGAAATMAGACGAAASGAGFCGADVCGGAACGADSCGVAASGVSVCGVAMSTIGACGADACGAAACGAAVTGVGGTLLGACGAAVGGVTACGADACGANACGINACPADACGADACAIDVVPIIPGI